MMADKQSIECPQCGHTNKPAEKNCANCYVNLEWALERGSQYWLEDAEARPPLILLSDDEIAVQTLVGIMLERAGYRVVKAPGAYITLELAERLHPDLIITDVMKPGMNGIEMTYRIKSDPVLRDIPVLILSSRGDAESVAEGLASGANDYRSKPILHHDLIAVVESILAGDILPLVLFAHNESDHEIGVSLVKNYHIWAFYYWREELIRLAKLLKPAVIVVAFHLREADGLDVLSQIKADPQVGSIPVVMWFDEPEPELEQQAMQYGAQAVYTGPPDGEALAEVLRSVLGE
jgi:CheY-like chemotaxis protein